MNSYIKNNLQPGEQLKATAEINGLTLIMPIIGIGASVILFFGPFMNYVDSRDYIVATGMTLFVLLIFLLLRSILELIKVLIYIFSSVLAFTNKRVISKKGLFSVKTLDSPLDKINDFDIRQSLFGKIFNYSRVIIKTSSSNYVFDYIKDAAKFKNLLVTTDKVQKVEIQSNNGSNSKYDDLSKLKELLDSNIITQEEFEEEKKKILNK